MLGRYFDEFKVGEQFTSPGRTVTEADEVNYASLAGSWLPVHTNEEFAKKSQYGTRIAHGMLIASIAEGLLTRLNLYEDTARALLEVKTRFVGAVKLGDTITVKATLAEKKETKAGDRGIIKLAFSVINQRDEVVLEGERVVMLIMKPKA